MDSADYRILENEMAKAIGQAVSRLCKKNGYEGEVHVSGELMRPSCYVDDMGVTHTGQVVLVNVDFDDEDCDDE